jgi:hypothetical protein
MAVTRKRGRVVWKDEDVSILQNRESLSTGVVYPLSRHHGCPWMQAAPVTGAWLTYDGGPWIESTSCLSTGLAQASIIVERTHPTGARFRYDRYLYGLVAGGRVLQAGPDKDVDFGHHHRHRPAWLDELYAMSTSTGW